MPQTMQTILARYVTEVQKIYGTHLKSVILYGSYARGDFTQESDVDIMVLVDLPSDKMDEYSDALAEVDYEYNVNYDIWMMPVVKNVEHFNHWVTAYPFYSNVQREGVVLYEAA
ncbi:MAG: nucleotidyltransferase domain-containing protein [Lachnospiraceae bacterium]|nr:nucleotidyltransferase domain-containing protein [Lachnospiraceae bacterium]MDD7177538.1 nucleotidyltransferase domain-containing protein [bacterium]